MEQTNKVCRGQRVRVSGGWRGRGRGGGRGSGGGAERGSRKGGGRGGGTEGGRGSRREGGWTLGLGGDGPPVNQPEGLTMEQTNKVCRGQRARASGGWRGRGRGGGRGSGGGAERGSGKGGERGGGRGSGRGGRREGGWTLGLGGDGPPVNQPEVRLGFAKLKDLETKTPDEIIVDLTSSRCFPATKFLLTQQSIIEDDWIVLIVSIVSKACESTPNENLLKLLSLLPESSFLNLHLRPYLNKLSSSGLNPSDVAVFLRNAVKIMNELLRRFPSCYADLPVSDLYCGTRMLCDTGQLVDDALVTEVDEIMKLRIKKVEELKRKEEEEKQRRKPRRNGKNILTCLGCFHSRTDKHI